MLKYIFIFLISILSSCSVGTLEITQTDEIVPSLRVFSASHGFDVFYDSGSKKKVSEYHTPGSIIINGSYFGVIDSSTYYPAGLWIENGIQKYSLGIDDPNLSHVVFLSGDTLQILPNNQTQSGIIECLENHSCRAFQAGPLVLSGNTLQNFGDSWHVSEPNERTLIGVTENGRIYFFISTDAVSLTDISKKILEGGTFKDDSITVLNLDGGPSTAYYDGHHGFREDTKLPIIFRINP